MVSPNYLGHDYSPQSGLSNWGRGHAERLSRVSSCEPSKFIEAVSGGWPKVISNLKSLLETGSTVLQEPYPN